FFSAKDEEQLLAALYEIIDAVSDTASTFAPPAIALDQTTRLANSSDVFLPMFRPGRLPRWIGNVKKYQLSQPGATGVAPKLLDAQGKDALDANGRFADTARSFWLTGTEPDGGEVGKGGVAHLLGMKRNLLTESGTTLVSLDAKNVGSADWGLTASDKPLEKALIDYITGKKKGDDTTPRRSMGDVLHSRPVMVTYANDTTALFVGTNEGYLHGFDTKTGAELFGFMPRELLKNVRTLYENKFDPKGNRPYGMDGPLTLWLDDKNNDGKIDTGAGEKAYLFAGMRRGGSSYYALDVSTPATPKLLWSIKGGSGDFKQLGQSWSAAIPAVVELEGTRSPALIFTGGYDDTQDDATARKDDTFGNALYIVEAATGKLLASVSGGSMDNGIPASPRVIDIDNNGVADRIYFVDVVGRLFRVDLPDSKNRQVKPTVKTPTLKQIADLGGDDAASNRRFYNEPDAAIVRLGTQRYVSLALGSGFREQPLQRSAIQDRLFMVKDLEVTKVADKDRGVIGESDLVNVDTSAEIPKEKFGWYYNIEYASGEKALARAVTVDNKVFFTTFLPETESGKGCDGSKHSAKIYAFDVRTAKAVVKYGDFDADPTTLTDSDRVLIGMPTSDILPEVHFNVRKDGDTGKVLVDTFIGGKFDQFLGQQQFESLRRVYWEQER
ncbi:MAG: pilus assembly protein, partial [Thiotrichales bacterium]